MTDENTGKPGDIYNIGTRQREAGSVCTVEQRAGSGTRGRKSSERFQRGLLTLTNTAGVLTCATTVTLTLFQRGYGGAADGAGFPASSLFKDSETNVPDENGLEDGVIRAASLEIGKPHYITGSGDSFEVADSVELEAYVDAIARAVGQNLIVRAQIAPGENAITYSLGNPLRNPSMRGANDLNAPGAHATPAVPLMLAESIVVPKSTGNFRPFAILLNLGRALSIGARAVASTANVYVPVDVSLEFIPNEM